MVSYEYAEKGATLTIAQLFEFCAGHISDMLLVFDGREDTRASLPWVRSLHDYTILSLEQ